MNRSTVFRLLAFATIGVAVVAIMAVGVASITPPPATAQDNPEPDGQALLDWVLNVDPYTEWGTWPDSAYYEFDRIIPSSEPHGASVRIYVNDIALNALDDFDGTLPYGSIIVKENYPGGVREPGEVAALTIMYKFEDFNPEANDWFWLKAPPRADVEPDAAGAVQGCIDCHSQEGHQDYVLRYGFGDEPATVYEGAAQRAALIMQLPDTVPPEVKNNADEWPLAHQNYENTREAVASINADNVGTLGEAWTVSLPGRSSFGAAASAPVVVDGVVYQQDLMSNVFAIDATSGEVIWEKRYESQVTGPNGVGIGYGHVYVASGVNSFAALNIETGEEVWSVTTPQDQPTGAIQPYLFDNMLYITTQAGVAGEEGSGVRGYEAGQSGQIYALDPATGETLWQFQTVEEGFWGNPEVNSGGGVWFSPAIDVTEGLTFWGTGNPAPFPGTVEYPNATSREEPNLYANSVIALDHESGELVWYNYVNPNDLFDLDVQISPMLATVSIDGSERALVIGSGKLGDVIALDRGNGETVWRTEVGIHQNDDVTEIPMDMTIEVWPGALGGVETPMAYADGTIYAPVLNLPTRFTATGGGAETGSEALANASEATNIGSGTSELVALDAATGIILWSHRFDAENYGGATIVNDLVLTATADGMIYALNRDDGAMVWSHQAPAGINAWPAVVDDTIYWPAGLGENAALVALRLGENGGMMATDDGDSDEMMTMEDYLTVNREEQTVNLTIIATLNDANGGFNFNGYANGNATITVPVGWTVNVDFQNNSDFPHSAGVVPMDTVSQTNVGDAVFEGAANSDFEGGLTGSGSFSFTASEQGTYAMACGVPGHAQDGMWITFEVGGAEVEPSFTAN